MAQPLDTKGKVEVIEFFWYGCPHCFDFDPEIMAWEKRQAKDVVFRQVPIAFREELMPHSQLFYALEALGNSNLNSKVIFAMHRENKRLLNENDIADWVASQGVDRNAFLAAYRSFAVVSKARAARQMGEAYRIAKAEMHEENTRIKALHDRMVAGLKDVEEVFINGHATQRVPHNLNMSFNYVEGESLIMGIKGLAVSSGSACTSASLEPSYVLRALGRSDELAHSSLRMTIGRWTTEEEIDYAIGTIKENVAKLRELSPLWEMFKDGIDISTIQWAAH